MKEGWKYKKLGEVCELYQPHTISTKEMVNDGLYNVFGANGIIGKYNEYNHEYSEILMTCRGATCGNINISTPKAWINGNAMVIHINNKNELLQKFLVYLLTVIDKTHIITGAAQPQITRQTLSPLQICFPSISEQQAIVSRLDTAFAKIDAVKANAEKQLSDAKTLFQKALSKAMEPKEGWEEKKLGEVCEITSVLVNPVEEKYKELLHVGGANIMSENGKLIGLKTAEEEGLISGKFLFEEKDVLYNKIRPYLKKIARPDFSGLCSADMYPLRHKKNITRDYLFYVLITKDFTEYAILNSGRAGMPKINRQAIFAYSFYLPPLSEQQRIVTHLDTLSEKLKATEERQIKIIAECDAMKQALLREVFE